MLAYLAGAIEYAPDGGEVWRRGLIPFLRDQLHWDVYDPTAEEAQWLTQEERTHFRSWKATNLPRFQSAMRKVIDKDLTTLERCDVIICLWDAHVTRGGGTHGELTLAHWLGKPVFLVLDLPQTDVSSWILGCATRVCTDFTHLRECLEQFARELKSNPLIPRPLLPEWEKGS